MWKIVQADLKYHKYLFVGLYLFVCVFFFLNLQYGRLSQWLFYISFWTLPVIGIFVDGEERKSHRIRFHATLPVSTKQIGWTRFPVFIAYWFSLMLICFAGTFLNRTVATPSINFPHFISLLLTAPFIGACMTINQDIRFVGINWSARTGIRFVVITMAVIAAVFYFGSLSTEAYRFFEYRLSPIFSNGGFAFSFAMVTAILIFSSVWVFEKRASYVE
jgi:hypothetical protein